MYSELSCIGERTMKQETRQPVYVSPSTLLNGQPEDQFRPLQLFDRVGTHFCRRNDELVESIPFEISGREKIRVRHSTSSTLSPF